MAVLFLSNIQNNDILYNRCHLRFNKIMFGKLLVHVILLGDLCMMWGKTECSHFLTLTFACRKQDYP